MENEFDLIVIGAGPGGYMAALYGAKEGQRVALIENGYVGGTCLNRGCIPTKTLLHCAHTYDAMKKAGELGLCLEQPAHDLHKIYARKDMVVGQLRDGILSQLKKNKVEIFYGTGSIDGVHLVTVNGQALSGKNILIATGSAPVVPGIPGISLPGVLTSDGLLDTKAVEQWPQNGRRLVIIGGGVIGIEFAAAFNALDYKVTVIEAMDRVLANMDREISQNVKMLYKKRGVEFYTGTKVEKIEAGKGELICHYTQKEAPGAAAADHILVAVGRRPKGNDVFGALDAPRMNGAGIWVNESYQTSYPSIYAIGDVTGGVLLAHAATAQGICAVDHMLGKKPSYVMAAVPSCVYTQPEIACVGITADEAKKSGREVIVKKYPMSANGKSLVTGQERGFIKIVADRETHQVAGAQLMCARATDMIGELGLAVTKGLTLEDIAQVIHPHPTYCEGIGEAVRS